MSLKKIEGDIMTTKNKDMRWVVLGFITVSLLVLGSIVVEYNYIDVIYLICVLAYFIRYLYIKIKC